MKGKPGPKPRVKPDQADEVVPSEQPETVATTEAVDDVESQDPPQMTIEKQFWYVCRQQGCNFATVYEAEADEHEIGTDHEVELTEKEATQTELFSEPDTVVRQLRGQMPASRVAELHTELAKLTDEKVQQQDAAKMAKERVKGLDAQILELVALLRDPHEVMAVPCKWEISDDGNHKSLVRLDTKEVLETKALSAEDRQKEAERVLSGNQAQQETSEAAAALTN